MAVNKPDRKQEILDAARREFIEHGVAGARLQSIAEQIDVTKAMIHYYFETKEKLFEKVFENAYQNLMGGLMDLLEQDTPLLQKLEIFIDRAVTRFHEKRELVPFIVQEMNKNPSKTTAALTEYASFDVRVLENQIEKAASNYEIAPVGINQLLSNILSLCMFPFASETFHRTLLDMREKEEYDEFLSNRKDIIADVIMNWLTS